MYSRDDTIALLQPLKIIDHALFIKAMEMVEHWSDQVCTQVYEWVRSLYHGINEQYTSQKNEAFVANLEKVQAIQKQQDADVSLEELMQ